MCEPTTTAALIGTAVSAAGTGVTLYNQHQTLEQQDEQNAAGIRRQQQLQVQANDGVNQAVKKLQANNTANQGQAGLDQYLAQVRAAAPTSKQNFAAPGVSSAYDNLAGADLQATSDRADQQAGLLSRIDAPAIQRQHEGAGVASLGTFLSQLQNNSSAEAYLNQLRLAGIHQNPWLDLAGGALKGAGTAYAAYGAGSAAGASGASPSYAGHGAAYGAGSTGGAW